MNLYALHRNRVLFWLFPVLSNVKMRKLLGALPPGPHQCSAFGNRISCLLHDNINSNKLLYGFFLCKGGQQKQAETGGVHKFQTCQVSNCPVPPSLISNEQSLNTGYMDVSFQTSNIVDTHFLLSNFYQ